MGPSRIFTGSSMLLGLRECLGFGERDWCSTLGDFGAEEARRGEFGAAARIGKGWRRAGAAAPLGTVRTRPGAPDTGVTALEEVAETMEPLMLAVDVVIPLTERLVVEARHASSTQTDGPAGARRSGRETARMAIPEPSGLSVMVLIAARSAHASAIARRSRTSASRKPFCENPPAKPERNSPGCGGHKWDGRLRGKFDACSCWAPEGQSSPFE